MRFGNTNSSPFFWLLISASSVIASVGVRQTFIFEMNRGHRIKLGVYPFTMLPKPLRD